ncbi:MAG: hypothetical protein MZV70_52510 [Desulfobacterales bacterium]|nr:hypothetical protein [Desulfobacterales bacterium]
MTKEKGIVRLKLVGRGKTAHGARPWLGENAIENLIADYFTTQAPLRADGAGPLAPHPQLQPHPGRQGRQPGAGLRRGALRRPLHRKRRHGGGGRGHPPRDQGRGRGGGARAPLPGRRQPLPRPAARRRRQPRGRLRARGERRALPLRVRHPRHRLGPGRRQQRPRARRARQHRQPARAAPHPGRVSDRFALTIRDSKAS